MSSSKVLKFESSKVGLRPWVLLSLSPNCLTILEL
jgi:hypothetical protein